MTREEKNYPWDVWTWFCTEGRPGFLHCARTHSKSCKLEKHTHCKPQIALHRRWAQHHHRKSGRFARLAAAEASAARTEKCSNNKELERERERTAILKRSSIKPTMQKPNHPQKPDNPNASTYTRFSFATDDDELVPVVRPRNQTRTCLHFSRRKKSPAEQNTQVDRDFSPDPPISSQIKVQVPIFQRL